MRRAMLIVILIFGSVALAQARQRPSYEKGHLTKMESVPCGYAQNSGKGIAGEILGTDSSKTQTQELLCQEYTLEARDVVYRIRPKDVKHPELLPIGEEVDFRIKKDELVLRVPEADNKEHAYHVVSMVLRSPADHSKPSLGHSNDPE